MKLDVSSIFSFIIHCSVICNTLFFIVNNYREQHVDETSNASTVISEVDGTDPQPSTSQMPPLGPPRKKIKLDGIPEKTDVSFSNPPILSAVFVDPQTKQKKCVISLQLLTGVKEIDLDIVTEEGEQVLKVTYNWPEYLLDAKKMFSRPGGQLMLPAFHPMVLALENSLMSVRSNLEDVPNGTITIKFPTRVKTDPNDWEKLFNKLPNGTVIVFLTFICEENDYTVSKSKKTLTFD